MNDSFNQLGFPEIRHRIVSPLEFVAGQAVALFEQRDRTVAINWLGGRNGLGSRD